MIVPLFSMGMAGLVYAVVLPLLLLPLLALLFVPSMLVPGARAAGVGKAISCSVLMTVGIVLMSASGLPALYAVIERLLTGQDRFTTEMYVALLLLFAGGGLTFLWHETVVATIDEPSRRVCSALFWCLWKLLGYILMLMSVLSFSLTMLFVRESFLGTWWVMPALLFLYGLLLSWVTRSSSASRNAFRSAPMATPSVTSGIAKPSPVPAKKEASKGKALKKK